MTNKTINGDKSSAIFRDNLDILVDRIMVSYENGSLSDIELKILIKLALLYYFKNEKKEMLSFLKNNTMKKTNTLFLDYCKQN